MTVAQQQSDARGLKGHLVWSRHTEGKTLILTTLKSGVPNMRSWGMVAMPSSSCLVAAMMAVACFKYLNIHVRCEAWRSRRMTAATHAPVVADVGHDSPAPCDQGAGAAACNGGSGVYAAGPAGSGEVHA